ncbi:oxidoreductase [Flavitalea flava]
MKKRTWFITGASTGLGRSLLEAVLAAGDRAVAVARKIEGLNDLAAQYPEQLLARAADVTAPETIERVVSETLKKFGTVDVLVNNAGYGVFGSAEETSMAQIRQQMEVNFFGVVAVTQVLLPLMRKQRSGQIFNISSAGGFVGFPGAAFYSASKFAIEGLSESLRAELSSLGIKVTIVEPGAFRTSFNKSGSMEIAERNIPDYADGAYKMIDWLQGNDGKQPGDPAKAALAIIMAARHDNPPERLVLGEDAYSVVTQKLEKVKLETEEWKELVGDLAFEGVEIVSIGG